MSYAYTPGRRIWSAEWSRLAVLGALRRKGDTYRYVRISLRSLGSIACSRVRRYRKEGPGVVYVVARVPTNTHNDYIAGKIAGQQYLDALELKVGHARDLSKRQRTYRKCYPAYTHIWYTSYSCPYRMLLGAHPLLRPFPL